MPRFAIAVTYGTAHYRKLTVIRFHAGSLPALEGAERGGVGDWRSVVSESSRTSSKLRLYLPSPRASRATSTCWPPGTQPANSA